MSFKVTGKISKILAKEEGTSKAGKEWTKQQFIVSNNDGYEGKEAIYCFEIFGTEKVDKFNQFNKVGDSVDVSFSIGTNEWKDKYFTSLSAYSVFKADLSDDKVKKAVEVIDSVFPPLDVPLNDDGLNDLPF